MTRPDQTALRAVLTDLTAVMAEAEANEPHAVLQTDPATGRQTVIAPFADLAAAIEAIDRLQARWARDNEPPMGVFVAIPYYAPDPELLTMPGGGVQAP